MVDPMVKHVQSECVSLEAQIAALKAEIAKERDDRMSDLGRLCDALGVLKHDGFSSPAQLFEKCLAACADRSGAVKVDPVHAILCAVSEYDLADHVAVQDEIMGRHAAVRGLMVRLGLYDAFNVALTSGCSEFAIRKALSTLTTEPADPTPVDDDIPRLYEEAMMEPAVPEGPVAWQWRALEDGEPRSAWKGPDEGDRAGWEALAKRRPDKYVIEKRPLYTRPAEQAVTDEMVEAAAKAIKARVPFGYGMTEAEAGDYARAALSAALTRKEGKP